MRIRTEKNIGYWIWDIGWRFKMKIRIIFSIRMRMRIKVDDQLRTNLILILPLNPSAGRSR